MNFITTLFSKEDIVKLHEVHVKSVLVGIPYYATRCAAYIPLAELKTIKEECLKYDMNVYVVVNRMFTEEELPKLDQCLQYLKMIDVDGIYYGDEGVFYKAKQLGIAHKLIYNPDTLITNSKDIQYYLDEGIQYVSLAKELSLEEIGEICKHCDASKLEMVIHGRLNMMHSKRSLLTNYMNFLNRDHTMKHNMHLRIKEEQREDLMPIVEDDLGVNVYTGFTLNSFEEIHQLLDMGIGHMRIEGIFHDLDYEIEAIKTYRECIKRKNQIKDMKRAYKKKYANDHVSEGFYYTKTYLMK